jgi:hypothetical protein
VPLNLLVDADEKLPLKAPVREIEVQMGRVIATFPDGHRVEGDADSAPVIPGENAVVELRGLAPSRVRVVLSSEAEAEEREAREKAAR